jgi:hypothetical protein
MTYNIEELLKQLTEEFIDYINDEKYVYKTCGDFVVVLEKLEDTITNENRTNISQLGDNKLYAKYRANKLLVKKLYTSMIFQNVKKLYLMVIKFKQNIKSMKLYIQMNLMIILKKYVALEYIIF